MFFAWNAIVVQYKKSCMDLLCNQSYSPTYTEKGKQPISQ